MRGRRRRSIGEKLPGGVDSRRSTGSRRGETRSEPPGARPTGRRRTEDLASTDRHLAEVRATITRNGPRFLPPLRSRSGAWRGETRQRRQLGVEPKLGGRGASRRRRRVSGRGRRRPRRRASRSSRARRRAGPPPRRRRARRARRYAPQLEVWRRRLEQLAAMTEAATASTPMREGRVATQGRPGGGVPLPRKREVAARGEPRAVRARCRRVYRACVTRANSGPRRARMSRMIARARARAAGGRGLRGLVALGGPRANGCPRRRQYAGSMARPAGSRPRRCARRTPGARATDRERQDRDDVPAACALVGVGERRGRGRVAHARRLCRPHVLPPDAAPRRGRR